MDYLQIPLHRRLPNLDFDISKLIAFIEIKESRIRGIQHGKVIDIFDTVSSNTIGVSFVYWTDSRSRDSEVNITSQKNDSSLLFTNGSSRISSIISHVA